MINPGKILKKEDGYEVQLERIFNHNIKTVWDALTNPEKMKVWFTDVEMDFRERGKMKIIFQDEVKTESFGEIATINPPTLFEFIWLGDGTPDEFARWELFEIENSKTKLVLTYSRLIEDYAISVSAGWHITLDYLEEMLDGRTEFPPFGGAPTQEGEAIKKEYEKLFNKTFNN